MQLDPDVAATLLDMRRAGKKLILITNSDWRYTKSLMSYAYDRRAPPSCSGAVNSEGSIPVRTTATP